MKVKAQVHHLRKLGAVLERLDEVEDVLDGGGFPQQLDTTLVKRLGLLLNILLLREKEQVAVLRNFFALA